MAEETKGRGKSRRPSEAQPMQTGAAVPGSLDDQLRHGATGSGSPPPQTAVYGATSGTPPTPAMTPAQVQAAHVGVPAGTMTFVPSQYSNTIPGLIDPSARRWANAPKVPNYDTPNLTNPAIIGLVAHDERALGQAVQLLQNAAEVDMALEGEMQRDEPRESVVRTLESRREAVTGEGGQPDDLAAAIDEAEAELADARDAKAQADLEVRSASRQVRDLRDRQRVLGGETVARKLRKIQADAGPAPTPEDEDEDYELGAQPQSPERGDVDAPLRPPPGGGGPDEGDNATTRTPGPMEPRE